MPRHNDPYRRDKKTPQVESPGNSGVIFLSGVAAKCQDAVKSVEVYK